MIVSAPMMGVETDTTNAFGRNSDIGGTTACVTVELGTGILERFTAVIVRVWIATFSF
jgi:hypothetical protein